MQLSLTQQVPCELVELNSEGWPSGSLSPIFKTLVHSTGSPFGPLSKTLLHMF